MMYENRKFVKPTMRKPRVPDLDETPERVAQAQSYARQVVNSTPESSGPVKTFRSGALQVAVWENEHLDEQGQVYSSHSVSFERRYKDKGGEWKSTNSMRTNDLPKATLLLNKAYEYLVLNHEER